MPITSETRIIEEYEVTVTPFDVMTATDLQIDLLAMGAPAISAAIGAVGSSPSLGEIDTDQIVPALNTLATSLGGGRFTATLERILRGSSVVFVDDGKPIKVDLITRAQIGRAFNGNQVALYKAAWFALEVNYRRPFEWAREKLGPALARMKAATAST